MHSACTKAEMKVAQMAVRRVDRSVGSMVACSAALMASAKVGLRADYWAV